MTVAGMMDEAVHVAKEHVVDDGDVLVNGDAVEMLVVHAHANGKYSDVDDSVPGWGIMKP